MKEKINFKEMEIKNLLEEKNKRVISIVQEKASLSQTGKKNSNLTRKLRKEIARIETTISEKINQSMIEG